MKQPAPVHLTLDGDSQVRQQACDHCGAEYSLVTTYVLSGGTALVQLLARVRGPRMSLSSPAMHWMIAGTHYPSACRHDRSHPARLDRSQEIR